MVLGIGLVSALIIAKKNSKGTRLQKLQQALTKRPKSQITLYQIPTKKLFILIFISAFLLALGQFQFMADSWCLLQLQNNHFIYQSSNLSQLCLPHLSDAMTGIRIVYFLMIVGVLLSLELRTVTVGRGRKQVKIRQFDCRSWKPRNIKIQWKEDEDVFWEIIKVGEERFSQNTSRFGLRIMNKPEKTSCLVLERADVFHARKAMVEIGSVLGFKADLKVHE